MYKTLLYKIKYNNLIKLSKYLRIYKEDMNKHDIINKILELPDHWATKRNINIIFKKLFTQISI